MLQSMMQFHLGQLICFDRGGVTKTVTITKSNPKKVIAPADNNVALLS